MLVRSFGPRGKSTGLHKRSIIHHIIVTVDRKTKVLILALSFILLVGSSVFAQGEPRKDCIVVYGDSRTGHAIHKRIVGLVLQLHPRVVFHTGDLVEDGYSVSDWADCNRITKELREKTEFFPALGNHERESPLYFKNFTLPGPGRWYSVEREGIHFIVLDSNLSLEPGSDQYTWLKSKLKQARQSQKPIIVILHHPLLSVGRYAETAEKLRRYLVPLFERYKVDLVFSGHDHNYQRFLHNSIYYVVTGGGGAPLHGETTGDPHNQKFLVVYHFCALSVSGNRIDVTVYDIDGTLIDQFSVEHRNK